MANEKIPFGVKLVSLFFILFGVHMFYIGFNMIFGSGEKVGLELLFGIPLFVLSFISIICSLGLMFAKRWSRILGLLLSVGFLLLAVIPLFFIISEFVTRGDNIPETFLFTFYFCFFIFVSSYMFFNKKVKEVFSK